MANAHHNHLNSSFHNGSIGGGSQRSQRSQRKHVNGPSPMKWSSPNGSMPGGSGRSRGPFVTQVTIRETQPPQLPSTQSNLNHHHISSHMSPQPASKV